jgi:hypothetical protein
VTSGGNTLGVTQYSFEALDHPNVQSTARYTHLDDDHVLDAAEQIGWLMQQALLGVDLTMLSRVNEGVRTSHSSKQVMVANQMAVMRLYLESPPPTGAFGKRIL